MPRLQAKKYLLTYPQCTLTKEEVSTSLQNQFDVKTFTISRELHQDGTPHIHAVIVLQSSPNTTNMRCFDINGFHCNIKALKTQSDCDRATKYIQKDGDYITNVEKSLSKRAELFKSLQENPGGLTPQWVKEHPEIMALNFDSLQKWMAFLRPRLLIPELRLLPKRRHTWYYGPSNSGKSTWLNAYLELHHDAQEIPRNNDFHGISPSADLLFSDEYRGHLSVQELNRLCDGRCRLNTKGGSTYIAYPVVVIVSNFSIQEIYNKSDPEEINSVFNRFNQYMSPINRPKFPTREL